MAKIYADKDKKQTGPKYAYSGSYVSSYNKGSSSGSSGGSSSGTSTGTNYNGVTYRVGADGKAPTGLNTGDKVVTSVGTYAIDGVNSDGTYKSSMIDKDTTTYNYKGTYMNGGGTSGGSSSGSSGSAAATGNGTYRPNFDYSAEAMRLAQAGDYDGAYRMLFGATDSRAAKLAATGGNDYGLSNQDIWNEIYGMKLAYEPTYEYEPGWEDDALDSVVRRVIGMSYEDWVNSDQYKALAERYAQNGQMAMEDVLGQVSSRTGGLASSYATTAASQQYNDYMSLLEQVARESYAADRGELVENAGLLGDYSDRNYGRYMDKINYDNADREYIYKYLQDQKADKRYDEEDAYNKAQTEKSDAISRITAFMENGGKIEDIDPALIVASGLSKAEIAQLGAISKDDARSRIEVYLGAGGKLSGLDPALVAASGLTQAELAQLEKYYAEQEVATGTASSSGGSKKSGGGGGSYDAIAAKAKGIGDMSKTFNYLSERVDNGDITEEEMNHIFTNICGYKVVGSGYGERYPDGKSSLALPRITRDEFYNGQGADGGLARQEFGTFDEYERAWIEFNGVDK